MLTALRKLGFQVVDVHVDAVSKSCFEVIVNHPIPRELAGKVALSEAVEVYEDYDQHDTFVGMGFLCKATNQCINGKWPS